MFEVPTACLPALAHWASLPGAPGADSVLVCAENGKLQVSSSSIRRVGFNAETETGLIELIFRYGPIVEAGLE